MRKRNMLFTKAASVVVSCAILILPVSASAVYGAEDDNEIVVQEEAIVGEITEEAPVALAESEESIVEGVVVNTTVRPSGHCMESLEVTVSDASALEGLTAEDFALAGQAESWLNTTLHDFTAVVSAASAEGNVLTLTITDFTEKYFYVDNFTVTCSKNAKLTFTNEKVTSVITPIADEFEQIRTAEGGAFDYNLYTPEDTSKAQPIVIAFHGFGDDDNLLQNKLAVAWADPVNQADRPCYVLAPLMGGYSYFNSTYRDGMYTSVYNKVQEMIAEGKVDPNRIYVVGKSFGGAAVYEFLEKYPDDVAGAIAMCGGYSYFKMNEDDLAKMVDVPLWIAHATTDPTVPVTDSRTVYNALLEDGSTVVKYTEYSDEEMAAAGVTEAMGNHSMEAVVLEDETYLEWLFAQTLKADVPAADTPGWHKIEDEWYYYDGGGNLVTGWKKISGKWYYLDKEDASMTYDWAMIDGKWYYFGTAEDGAMKTGWQKLSGSWYYFGGAEDGAMKTGWQRVDGSWYYMYSNGKMASSTWIGNYYVDETGKWAKSR